MADGPYGYPCFEHLWALPGALRLADRPASIRSLGDATVSMGLVNRSRRIQGGRVRCARATHEA